MFKNYNGRILPKLDEAQQIPNKIYAQTSTFTHQTKNAESQREIFVSNKRTMTHHT